MTDYLDPTRIRALAANLGLRPSKGRGQNFLFDANTIRRIVSLARVSPADIVLEVGPGLGSLTVGLLDSGARVTAVEIESVLARQLPITMAEIAPDKEKNLTVFEKDALRLSVDDLPAKPTRLVANLPYNISVPVLLHALATFDSITSGLVMVQLEVAERLCASPNSKAYGVPSAKLAWYATATRVGTVPASVFWPQPNVESGLVRFTRHDPPFANSPDNSFAEGSREETLSAQASHLSADRQAVFHLIDVAFSQRRKMLRSILAGAYGTQCVSRALEATGIDPQARGETLDIRDFTRLASALAHDRSTTPV